MPVKTGTHLGQITPDGQVKVLDFGLAKALEENQQAAGLQKGGR